MFSCADVERFTTSPSSSPSTSFPTSSPSESNAPTALGMDALYLQGYVECSNGNEVVNGVRTERICQDVCNGQCCVESYACQYFTGKVCRDKSCKGWGGCKHSNIPYVVGPSCTGNSACKNIGNQGGAVDSIIRFCNGHTSCEELGHGSRGKHPTVGKSIDSCKSPWSCEMLGRMYPGKKSLGNIVELFVGEKSCQHLFRVKLDGTHISWCVYNVWRWHASMLQ